MAWLSKTKDPELAAFEKEAIQYLDNLYANALRLTHNPADAEDLVQETFLKAYRFRARFEQGSNLRAWLFRIQYNAFVNRYRRRTKRREIYDELSAGPVSELSVSSEAVSALSDPDSNALRPLLAAELEVALDTLPEDQRSVVLLADVEEFSYREIAEIVGCPIGTVMSRLHRARAALKERLLDQARAMGIVGASADSGDEPAAPVRLDAYRRTRSHN